MSNSLESTLQLHQKSFKNLTLFDLNGHDVVEMDFSKKNKNLIGVDFSDEKSFCNYVNEELNRHQAIAGIGGYGEDRIVYAHNEAFAGEEPRSIHLGIDVWAEAGTPIFAPLGGTIHSFKVNKASGDYGPTIILQHHLNDIIFYTLYGHLSISSLDNLHEGMTIKPGQQLATLGEYHENVHWPPHLHFQIIKDLDRRKGDYPGVAAPSESKYYLKNCPDPNLILGIH